MGISFCFVVSIALKIWSDNTVDYNNNQIILKNEHIIDVTKRCQDNNKSGHCSREEETFEDIELGSIKETKNNDQVDKSDKSQLSEQQWYSVQQNCICSMQ